MYSKQIKLSTKLNNCKLYLLALEAHIQYKVFALRKHCIVGKSVMRQYAVYRHAQSLLSRKN